MSMHGKTVLDIDLYNGEKRSKEFFDQLYDWIYMRCDDSKDFGYFKNIIRNAGLDGDYCCGEIDHIEFDDDDVNEEEDHARITVWCRHYYPSMMQLWIGLIQKHLPDFGRINAVAKEGKPSIGIQYRTESPDAEMYCTNDPSYVGGYYCDGDDEATEDDIREFLCGAFHEEWGDSVDDCDPDKYIPTQQEIHDAIEGNIDDLIAFAQEGLSYPSRVGIWEDVDVWHVDEMMNA